MLAPATTENGPTSMLPCGSPRFFGNEVFDCGPVSYEFPNANIDTVPIRISNSIGYSTQAYDIDPIGYLVLNRYDHSRYSFLDTRRGCRMSDTNL